MAGKKKKGVELALGYVSIVADGSSIADSVEKEIGVAAEKGGKAGSEKGGKSLKEGLGKQAALIGGATGLSLGAGLHDALGRADLQGSLQAQLGSAPGEAKKVADAAGSVFAAGWGDSLNEVAKHTAVLKQSMDAVGDKGDLEKLATKSTALAAQFEQDSDKLANSAKQMVQTGLASSMDEAYDVMTRGLQTNNKLGEDLTDSMDEYSTHFRQLGLSGADAVGLMNQGLAAGARNGDQVADTLKEFTLQTQAMGNATSDAYKDIGLDATKMQAAVAKGGPEAKAALSQTLDALRAVKDPAKQSADAVGIFGTKSEDMQQALLKLDPSKAAEGLGKISGAADDFTNNAAGFDQVISSLHRSLSEGLGKALTPLIPQLKDLAGAGMEFFKWLGDNPVITAILLGIAGAITAVAAAQWLWNAAQLANPTTWIILAIIAAIALVVAIIYQLSTHWDVVVKALGDAWNGFVESLRGAVDKLSEIWGGFTNGIRDATHGAEVIWGGFVNWIKEIWDGFTNWIKQVWDGFMAYLELSGLTRWFNKNFGWIGTFISDIFRGISQSATEIFGWVGKFIGDIWAGVAKSASDNFGWIGGFLSDTWHNVLQIASDVFGWINNFVTDVWRNIAQSASDNFGWVSGFVDGVWQGIQEGAKGMANLVIGYINMIIDGLNTASDLITQISGGDVHLGHIGKIPGLATGGTVTQPGTVLVGENGPELLKLGAGASVIPLDHPAAKQQGGGGNKVELTIINPVAEKASESVRKAGQLIGVSLV